MSIRLLFVEDDPFYGSILKRHLDEAGFDVMPASHGEAAIELAKSASPQMVLLGMKLSRKDGWEVLETVRASDWGAELPVILLSPLGTKEDVDRAFALGATDYLIKTHHAAEDIVELVRKHLFPAYV